jgi:hypothetical protein
MSWFDDGVLTNEDMLRMITNALEGLPEDDETEDEAQLTEIGSNPMGEPVFRDESGRICTFDDNGSLLYETPADDDEWEEGELPWLNLEVTPGQDGIDVANQALTEWHQMGEIDLLNDDELEIEFEWGDV